MLGLLIQGMTKEEGEFKASLDCIMSLNSSNVKRLSKFKVERGSEVSIAQRWTSYMFSVLDSNS